MPKLILLIGLPGSGKSTLARHLMQSEVGHWLVSTDAIRKRLFGDEAHQGPWLQVWQEIERQFKLAIQQLSQIDHRNQAALYDATNAVRRHRREVVNLARMTGFTTIVGVWLDSPLEVCLERNQHRHRRVSDEVIQRMHRCLTDSPPSRDDGLDTVIRYPSHNGHGLQDLVSVLCSNPPDGRGDRPV